jgi:transcriptional regulator with XRE-family HTH domain
MKTIHTKERAAFVELLKRARKDTGLTQAQVAKKLKCSQSYISKIESGELKVGAVELKAFANLYNKSVEYFLK